jgi:hypothetical protein
MVKLNPHPDMTDIDRARKASSSPILEKDAKQKKLATAMKANAGLTKFKNVTQ